MFYIPKIKYRKTILLTAVKICYINKKYFSLSLNVLCIVIDPGNSHIHISLVCLVILDVKGENLHSIQHH